MQPNPASTTATTTSPPSHLDPPPTSPPPRLHSQNTPTLRSLTGPELMPSPPTLYAGKRYHRQNILVFRSASGKEQQLARPSSPILDDSPLGNPRISSVTDSAAGSPDSTHPPLAFKLSFVDESLDNIQPPLEDDAGSTYSHASAVNLDDLDDDDIAGLASPVLTDVVHDTPKVITRQVLERNRQSFAKSFAKAKQAQINKKAVVLARPELQPCNRPESLVDRCLKALAEALDLNLTFARICGERFNAFQALFTRDERIVISELLRESSQRLKSETPTPWRSPLYPFSKKKPLLLGAAREGSASASASGTGSTSGQKQSVMKSPWNRRNGKVFSNDTMLRSVVFGSHVIPGVQSAESLLLRMAGEYQREEVNRKASRSERLDIPLSFAMTLTGALATFARLECNATYKKYRSRSAANRRSNPQALIALKTRYDGLKLSFAVTLHGESPCTVLFRRPRIFSPRKIDDYATLVTEAKDILAEFGREVSGQKD